ncbi:hypothetical protein WICPIJ_006443 [Wickerhamomyces pijperi]|uniref:Enhancer of polycomb-like protein n=1 Tax=Wickerhamomyces pijperi TaxID=599730 RepID=A0A9P8Q1Q6_WICPI|nr:hypothetical protein WICPIJ_006443 [Wickerhamomyces pijperi]
MAGPALSAGGKGGRFRQRKISTKQTLQILKQSQLSDVDNADLQQRDLQEIETGVDKNEEDEEHLQKILKKSGISSTANEYIPTPDASKVWEEAKKYYTGTFQEPDSYIKSSCQVEDYSGCLYNMDEEDDEFLKEYNKSKNKKRGKVSEDEFESVMCALEQYVNEKQPFLITDPSQLMSFVEIKDGLKTVDKSSVDNIRKTLESELDTHPFVTLLDPKNISKVRALPDLLEKYGEDIYQHFKKRKLARHGKTIHPSLKFNQEDDNDPYSCFRQRQFRQQRKTRRADTQSSEKLIKLFKELKATRELSLMVAQREKKRFQAIQTEHEIFELRCKVKKMKRELGITDSDEDLVTHKKRKVVPPPAQPLPGAAAAAPESKGDDKNDRKALSKLSLNTTNQDKSSTKSGNVVNDDSAGSEQPQQQTFQPYVKLPPSKIPDLDLESVTQILEVKHTNVKNYVTDRMKKRKLADVGYTNFTDDPNSPYLDLSLYDQKVVDQDKVPYSSIASSLSEVKSYGHIADMKNYVEHGFTKNPNDIFLFNLFNRETIKKQVPETYNPFYSESVSTSDPKYTIRKRVSRYGQTFVDRKYMVTKPTSFSNDHSNSSNALQDKLSVMDQRSRHEDRWRYDRDDGIIGTDIANINEDPARLNKISNETQIIRFGGMLLTKAYDTMKEAYNARLKRQQKQKVPELAEGSDTQQKSQSPLPNVNLKNNDNNDDKKKNHAGANGHSTKTHINDSKPNSGIKAEG